MTIKARIILGFLLTIIVMAGSTIPYVTSKMRDNAEQAYMEASHEQLQIMGSYIEGFIGEAERSLAVLAADEVLINAEGLFPIYVNNPSETAYKRSALDSEAAKAAMLIARVAEANPAYAEVYAGYPDGSYGTSMKEGPVPAGYNSSKRPWYVERMNSGKPSGLANSYLSISGEMVLAVTHLLRSDTGVSKGVLGVDVSLNGLSEKFTSLNFGRTGYFMLIENTGRILCDPRDKDLTGKVIGTEVKDPGLEQLFSTQSGLVLTRIKGVSVRANVFTTSFGWKIVVIQDESEIFASANEAIRSVSIIYGIVTLIMLAVAWYIVRSINRPLHLIVAEADKISQGNLDVHLEMRDFYGELAELRHSLLNMVTNLQNMIKTAHQKSNEAEEQTLLAKAATEQAEAARQQAENARRDGMLVAAGQLEEVVLVISSASNQLSARIAQSDHISEESAARLSEAATAMNQMNATVREVAGNASAASSMSDETRGNAENGAQIVRQALESIDHVHSVSMELKGDMSQLNEHALAINRIMGVISDIADQTNLLALNAAIEAARAGDAGRGFAVVADEVRKLAEKTMASTQDVGNAIKAIQESTAKSVSGMDKALTEVEIATDFARQSGEALRQIVSNVEATADQVRAIATASEEQSAASEEINQSIVQVNDMSGQTAQAMSEAAQAVAELAQQAHRLSALISNMKKA
ncbi:MAG: methyl-accepting chemotaxis protein [Desulfovibrio sp.]|uniref:methyl-accepting chemotaxis protein n=1 Tax=Desulfovibrio sp. TaxID=885 RepID=UPI0039E405D3